MTIPASVRRRFERDVHFLESVSRKVLETVSNYCHSHGYAISGRIKGVTSLAEKLETGRFSCWSEIDDLYACKIIIPSLHQEAAAIEFLEGVFEGVRITRRATTKKWPEVFRFDATRFVGRLRDTGDPRMEPERAILFEVQVLTAFEHAWSTATHALAYKSGDLDWTTRRVAAQLRATVEQLDMIVLGASSSASFLEPSPCPELEEQREILTGFQSLIRENVIPEELTPDKWSRFAENVHSLLDRRRRSSVGPKEVLEVCRRVASEYSASTFPRLVSLHQFVMGSLLKDGAIKMPERYTPLLTAELQQVFELANISRNFDLES